MRLRLSRYWIFQFVGWGMFGLINVFFAFLFQQFSGNMVCRLLFIVEIGVIYSHFMFDALNSIRALIDENPERARRAVTELSNILRSSLKTEKGETVSLEDELKIVKDYLALENMRFEDRLHVEYDIDENTLTRQV